MNQKYTPGHPNLLFLQALKQFHLRGAILLFLMLSVCSISFAQKGKNKGGGGNKDVTLHTCIQDIGNGLTRAEFGYTNPTNQTITVGEDDSVIFLSDKDDDDENNGIEKIMGITSFEKGTHNDVISVVFNNNGHAKWTVTFNGNNETKVRANAASVVCELPCVVCPLYGGVGKIYTPIGAELTALATNNAGDIPSEIIYQINNNDEVLIEIIPSSGRMQDVLDLLQLAAPAGFGRTASDFILDPAIIAAKYFTIDVYFPISRLLELNDYGDGTLDTSVNFARALIPPDINSGTITSQGDPAMLTDVVRESFSTGRDENGNRIPLDGRGIKIGVISDSYDRINPGVEAVLDIDQSDLPGPENDEGNNTPPEILKDFPGTATDEGRAMMQIIHDVAPKANLGFYTGVLSPRDLAEGIDKFSESDYMVINDDVAYPLEPFFGDGQIAESIRRYTDKPGRVYISSAGNFADNAQQGIFVNSSPAAVPSVLPAGTVAHVFGTNPDGSEDISNKISLEPGTYMFVLQWDKTLASQNNNDGEEVDLDMYIMTDNNQILVDTNRDNNLEDAAEAMLFQATQNATANIVITSANGPLPPGLAFRYIAFRSKGLEYLEYPGGAPTVSGHAMTDVAVTVGAVFHELAQNPSPEAFSSYAGVLSNNQLLEVDISAPDGVDINNITGFGTDTDGNDFHNFFGTSAAAPHAAAAFALVLSGLPSWYDSAGLQQALDAAGVVVDLKSNELGDQALALLKSGAISSGNPEQAGIGLINATASLLKIAAQTAVLDSLDIGAGVLSAEEVEVTINGNYFPENPTVLFVDGEDQETLPINSITDSEIVVTVPPFIGNPSVVVNTEAFPGSMNNGGLSNALPILDDGRIAIRILADTVEIEYGQEYAFSFTALGLPDGVEIGDELPDVKLESPADERAPYPSVTNYSIFPSFDLENATPAQLAALDGYLVGFVNGLLKVSQKDLEIIPEPEMVTYGDAILLELNYIYDPTGVADNADFLNVIKTAHAEDFFEDNTLALINRFNAVVNTEIFDELQGGSWMATENTLLNRFNAVVNEMDLINLDVDDLENYLVNRFNAVVNTELNRFNAVVNGEGLLGGLVFFNNRFNAVVNESGLGGVDDENDYGSVFAILHNDDDAEDDPSAPGISKFYALNLITGLDVTTGSEVHYSFPGAFLSSIASNFVTTFTSSTITVNPATLTASTGDLVIDQGDAIDPALITSTINGYVYEETLEDVFPDGISYLIEDAEGVAYTPGATGVYFIKIAEPKNYIIEYNQVGVLYVNPTGNNLRKIRTYLDCVEENFDDPDGFFYIAHYRYENPNDETIYIAEGPENQLTGTAPYIGELPFIFLPGEGTFEIRFDGSDGKVLKWELTSRNSTHKSSTTSSASSNSNKCNMANESGAGDFTFYPNPVNGILFIDQDLSEVVTLDVFDIFGILYLNTSLNGRNGPTTHEINMGSYLQGMYFFRITTKDYVFVHTVVKE